MSESRIHLTDQEWNNFREVYLEEFEHAPRKQAFANACRRIKADGGRVPSFKTLLRKLGRTKDPAQAQEQEQPSSPSSPTSPSKAKPGPSGDYQERLELIVRLYRTRSETAVDAVCDRLLPELEV